MDDPAWRSSWSLLAGVPADALVGLRVGLVIVLVSALRDRIVVFGILGTADFYDFAGPWIAYAILLTVPWRAGVVQTPVSAR